MKKTLAINGILAQTINTCCAQRYAARPALVMTSMAVRDDISMGESFSFAERVTEEGIQFDYKLLEGSAKTRNAILLLEYMGFDASIVERARTLFDKANADPS